MLSIATEAKSKVEDLITGADQLGLFHALNKLTRSSLLLLFFVSDTYYLKLVLICSNEQKQETESYFVRLRTSLLIVSNRSLSMSLKEKRCCS